MYLIVILIVSIIAITALYVFSIPTLQISGVTPKPKQLDKWLSGLYSQGKFQGVVLLATDGEVIFSKGYGGRYHSVEAPRKTVIFR